MKNVWSILIALSLVQSPTITQSQERCGTDLRWEFLKKSIPNLDKNKVDLEQKIKTNQRQLFSNSYTIPVVVHIIHKNNNEYLSLEQINSQLEVLNQDFNRTNADATNTPAVFENVAANCNIEFCLAQRTPQNEITNGITYTSTDVSSFSLYDNRVFHDSLGGKTIWDPSTYLNIYVCDLSSVLGFASFPGGIPSMDGIVIDFENFGTIGNLNAPYDQGRTTTHELGHYLNLLHIWGSGSCSDDFVDDTPIQEDHNFGCPAHPSPSCSNNGDMFQNFMDYTNDACMNLFTEGQKQRMLTVLNTEREELTNNTNCMLPFEDIGVVENISPSLDQTTCGTSFDIKTKIQNHSTHNINNFKVSYQIDNNEIKELEWNGSLGPQESMELVIGTESLSIGTHSLSIYTSQPNGYRDINNSNDSLFFDFDVQEGNFYNIQVQTDNYAEEVSWTILNENQDTTYIYNQLVSNELNTEDICLNTDSCYTFEITDEYSDGICCDFGNGYIAINNEIFSGEFESELSVDLCELSSIKTHDHNIIVYPNPTKGILNIKSDNPIVSIELIDIHSKIVRNFAKLSYYTETIYLSELEFGFYFIKIKTKDYITTKKIIFHE